MLGAKRAAKNRGVFVHEQLECKRDEESRHTNGPTRNSSAYGLGMTTHKNHRDGPQARNQGGTTKAYRTFSDDCTRIRRYAYGLMGGTLGCLVAFAFRLAFYFSNFRILTVMIATSKEVSVTRLEQCKKRKTVSNRQESFRSAVSW